MNIRIVTTVAVATLIGLGANVARSGDTAKSATTAAAAQKPMTLLETAKAGGFTTLLTAIEAAGLTEALSGKEPLTVFAPTNEAFAKLPAGALDGLLKDTEALKQVLLYHVVAGNVASGDVVKLKSAKTLNGQDVKIDARDGVKINNSTVVKADVAATNGTIHVIDTVLLPKK